MPSFSSLPLIPPLLEVVAELGFTELTPIQAESIPLLLAGKDVLGQSRTGSGKTAAFGLPLLNGMRLERRELQALILCPTRELSAQVARELRKLGRRHAGLQVLVVAGGEPLRAQAAALERGVHVVVGTPGRVLDHLGRDTLRLGRVRTLVLDEADRMLEMGFQTAMEEILGAVPDQRQTVLFSATYPPGIEALSRTYQQDAVRVTIESEPEELAPIRQQLITVEADDKPKALRAVLLHHAHESALVFANLKSTVAQLDKWLSGAGVSSAALHGDLEQFDRDRVLAKFRNGSTRVLVATDVAARGLDVADLDLVVNFDLPGQPEVYVHRIGRTGRAGKSGLAVSLATPREQPKIKAIQEATGAAPERVPLSSLRTDVAPEAAEAAENTAPTLARDAKMQTLRISGGRKQKMRPGDILGALTGEAGGLEGSQIGKIEIHDNFSYVAIERSVCEAARKSLSNGRIKGKKFIVTLEK